MKALRYLALAISVIVLGSSLASSQSLAEVAKKEKERRKENKAEAKAVITDRELTKGYGGGLPTSLPSQSQSQTQAGTQSGEDQAADGEDATAAAGDEEKVDETKTREYWQNRVKATKDKIAGLEQQLQSNDWGQGQRQGVDPRGMNNLQRREETEQKLAAARAELQSIQDEARRAGVPPGWAR